MTNVQVVLTVVACYSTADRPNSTSGAIFGSSAVFHPNWQCDGARPDDGESSLYHVQGHAQFDPLHLIQVSASTSGRLPIGQHRCQTSDLVAPLSIASLPQTFQNAAARSQRIFQGARRLSLKGLLLAGRFLDGQFLLRNGRHGPVCLYSIEFQLILHP